jgi:hypothetical protein
VRKTHVLPDKEDPATPWATATASGTLLLPQGSAIVRVGAELDSKHASIEVNDAGKRVQLTAGRSLWNNRLTLVASPIVTYGALRSHRIDFGGWLPQRTPSAMAGLPRSVGNTIARDSTVSSTLCVVDNTWQSVSKRPALLCRYYTICVCYVSALQTASADSLHHLLGAIAC